MVTWAEDFSKPDAADDGASHPPRDIASFRTATALSLEADSAAAVAELAARLRDPDGRGPDFLTVHHGGGRAAKAVWGHLARAFGAAALHGGSSCLGVMTDQGAAVSGGDAIGAFGIWDPAGCYGTAMAPIGADPRSAAASALKAALSKAGRDGEAPDLVWLTAAPGCEEAVIEGLRDVLGGASPIIGGSAADNAVAGGWTVFDATGIGPDAVVVSVLFPSVPFGLGFESGYAPTAFRGVVTSAAGRSIFAIDGKPAAQVYAEWTGIGRLDGGAGHVAILGTAALCPLGRKLGEIEGMPIHLLAHPSVAHADGRLDLFAEVEPGEEVWLMRGSHDSLVQRAGRIAEGARYQIGESPPAGALMVYCGGCMLAVGDRMDEVARSVSLALSGAPFLGVFSFGEQGEMLDHVSRHGNLMISCIAFAGGDPDYGSAQGS